MGRSREDLIETARLRLEPIDSRHAEGLLEATIASRAELLPWMPWARETTSEGLAEEAATGGESFAVVEKATSQVLGVVGLNPEEDGSWELHYWIRTDHARRGLTTEAALALLHWATHTLHATRFKLWAGRDNLASRRVAEKLGFVHVGPLDWRPEGGMGHFDAERYELTLG